MTDIKSTYPLVSFTCVLCSYVLLTFLNSVLRFKFEPKLSFHKLAGPFIQFKLDPTKTV
jgi:hypothetical protein